MHEEKTEFSFYTHYKNSKKKKKSLSFEETIRMYALTFQEKKHFRDA